MSRMIRRVEIRRVESSSYSSLVKFKSRDQFDSFEITRGREESKS